MPEKLIPFNFRIDADLKPLIDKLAESFGLGTSDFLRLVLRAIADIGEETLAEAKRVADGSSSPLGAVLGGAFNYLLAARQAHDERFHTGTEWPELDRHDGRLLSGREQFDLLLEGCRGDEQRAWRESILQRWRAGRPLDLFDDEAREEVRREMERIEREHAELLMIREGTVPE